MELVLHPMVPLCFTSAHFRLSIKAKQVLVPEARQKFHGYSPKRSKALAAAAHQGCLDDSWATHTMAGLVLVSPLVVRGALAATHALQHLTGPSLCGTFCLRRTCTAMTTPGDTIGLGQQCHGASHHRQLTKRPSTRTTN